MTDHDSEPQPPRPTRQIQVQYHDNPKFTCCHGDDVVLLIRHRPDSDLDDAFVAEADDLSPDQFRDDEDDT